MFAKKKKNNRCRLYASKAQKASLNYYNLQFRSWCNYVSKNIDGVLLSSCPLPWQPDCRLPRQEKWGTMSAEFSLGARTIFLPFFVALPSYGFSCRLHCLSIFPLLCNWSLLQNQIGVLRLFLTACPPCFPPSGSTGGRRRNE
jgi:hypothetical protein